MKPLNFNLRAIPQHYVTYLILLIITVVYLFPAFLGKIDTPIDIRDSRMYPWSYYAVDKKMKTFTLWKDTAGMQSITVAPNSSRESLFKIDIDQSLINELNKINLRDVTYYFTFDFKGMIDRDSNLTFDVYLTDPATRLDFKLPAQIIKLATNEKRQRNEWSRAYVSLKEIMKSALTVDDLNTCNLKVKVNNNSKNTAGVFYVKDIKLLSDDYSKMLKAHNPYVEDLIQSFTPARELYGESIRSGKIPFWNNYILTGTEFITGEPQVGYFHPLYIVSYLLFDHFTAHLVLTFICLLLCGIGAYSLTRYWGFGQAASLLTSIVYMFNPYNIQWFSFEHMLMNSATLPFLLLSYEKHIKQERFLNKHLIISALLLGLVFLSGHLQIVYYTVIFFFLYAFFLFLRDILPRKDRWIVHVKGIVFIFSIALMIASVVLIPFFPFMQDSHRVPLTEAAMKEISTPLKAFLTLVKPAAIDEKTLSYFYCGIMPLFFSIISFSMFFKRELTIFLFSSIIFSLLICTGSPVFFLIKDFIPGFNQIQHHRFIEIYSYSVPFLTGIGFQVLINRITFLSRKVIIVFSVLVVLISACDLLYNSSTYYMSWFARKDYKPIPSGSSLEFLVSERRKQKEPFRVLPFVIKDVENVKLSTSVAVPNTLTPYGLEDVSGYSSFIPKDLYALFIYVQTHDLQRLYSKKINTCFDDFNIPYPISNYKSKVIDLLNVKYFLVPNFFILESKDAKKVYEGDCAIYENVNYFPRAFVVPGYKVISSAVDTIVELDKDNLDAYKEVILMTVPLSLRGALATKQSRSRLLSFARNDMNSNMNLEYKVDFLKYKPDNITLKVNINQAGFLVLGNNLNDNWRVKINDREGKHYQANLVQRAVYLPGAGDYVVEFYYLSRLFLIGLSITCLGVFVLTLLWFNMKRKS